MRRRSHNGPFQRLLEAGSRTTFHGKIRTRGGKRKATVRAGKQSVYKGVRIIPVGNGEFETSLDSSRFESKRDAKRFVDSWKKGQSNPRGKSGDFSRCVKAVSQRRGVKDPNAICAAQERKAGKLNPADAAAEAYRIFHGRDPKELVTITKTVHHHKHLPACGELRRLVIENDKYRVTLTKFRGALLCFNEEALDELRDKGRAKISQLFVEGGDQTVNLEDFGIDSRNAHEVETLGKAVNIDYFTRKDHLGSEGGTAVFAHKFRTTNENGKHKTVRIAKYPDVIYRLRDKSLEFSGGSYFIRAEGIDL